MKALLASAITGLLLLGIPSLAGESTFEITGSVGKDRDGEIVHLEFDGVIPVGSGNDGKSLLFVQPGAVFQRSSGGESLQGASIGLAYRIATDRGNVGLNAFLDGNLRRGLVV